MSKPFELTPDQRGGMDKLLVWLETAKGGDIFRFYGEAGCGKTSCSIEIKNLKLKNGDWVNPLYLAFTNRAVSILRSKGCWPCSTVHSVLYDVGEYEVEETPEDVKVRQKYLDAVMRGVPPSERPPAPKSNTEIGFGLRDEISLMDKIRGHRCVVVDEASMIGERMGGDLRQLNLPIVAVGDPGQLKPVGDEPMFDPRDPEVLLTEVLRTDTDILALAKHLRKGGWFSEIENGENFAIGRKAPPEWFDVEQVACGVHDKRRALNKHIRELKGYTGFLPNVGEKLIAVANNKDDQIFNGTLWIVTRSEEHGDYANMDLVEYNPRVDPKDLEFRINVDVHMSCFIKDIKSADDLGIRLKHGSTLMTWGWCVTVHKLQGSEFNTGLVFDDGDVFKGQQKEWRYTAVTRFAKYVYVVSRR